jgi:hypothetical protein
MNARPLLSHALAVSMGAVTAGAVLLGDPFAGIAPGASVGLAAADRWAELERSNTALRDELTALRRADPAVREGIAGDEATVALVAPGPRGDAVLLDLLWREFREQDAAGRWQLYGDTQEQELAELVLRVWIETGAAERAFHLLVALHERLPDLRDVYFVETTRRLHASRSPLVRDALLLLLRRNLHTDETLGMFGADEAAAGLAMLDQLAGAEHDPDANAGRRRQRCHLLFAMRRPEAGLALFDDLTRAGDANLGLWARLEDELPLDAAERYRARLAAAVSDEERAHCTRRLVEVLRGIGKVAEARALVDGLLAADADDSDAMHALARLDPAAALAWAERRARQQPNPTNLNRHARRLHAAGRGDEAQEVGWQAWLASPLGDEHHEALFAIADPPLVERAVATARQRGRPDSEFGELLGDAAKAMWRAGERDRALEWMREARRRDPTDSEWQWKLACYEQGRDPEEATGGWWRVGEDW